MQVQFFGFRKANTLNVKVNDENFPAPFNERPRGKPRGITERNPQEHAQQAAGYSSSRKSGIKCQINPFQSCSL